MGNINRPTVLSCLRGAAATSVVIAAASIVCAQAQDETAPEEEAGARRLNSVTVTATKREETVQDVSLSVTAVDGALVADRGLERISQVGEFVPNVQIGNNDGPARSIAIRGLGSGNNRGFETSVGLFLDGVYLGRELFLTDSFYDIERVEAIKGPQGALFGKNTIAGAISVITQDPTDEFEAELSLTAGSQSKIGYDALISGPISDTLSGRLYLHGYERDGFYDNTFTGEDVGARTVSAARGKLLWEPTSNLSAKLTLSYSDLDQTGVGIQATDSVPCISLIDPNAPVGAPGCAPGTVVHLFSGFGTQSIIEVGQQVDPLADGVANDKVSLSPGTGDSRKNLFSSVEVDYDIGDHVLTYIGSYAEISDSVNNFDPDYTGLEIYRLIVGEDYEQQNHELRITSPGGQFFDYIAGVYYFSSTIEGSQFLSVAAPFPGPPQGAVTGLIDQDTDSISLFGQGTFNFTDQFRGIIGMRYIEEEKSAISRQDSDPSLFIFPDYSEMLDFEDDATLVNAALEYDISDDILAYASYSQGFKAGGINFYSLGGDNFTYDSEESDGYEVGLKTTLLDGAATFNVAYFLTEFSDLQTSTLVGNSLQIANAAEATTQGIEVEINWQITDNLRSRFAGAILEAEYDSYPDAPCQVAVQINSVPPCSQDLTGGKLDGAPENSAAFNLTYDLPLENFFGDFVFSGDVIYTGNYFAFNSGRNDPATEVGDVTKLNGTIALNSHDDHWTIALQGTNLTDEEEIWSIGEAFQMPGSRFANISPPRQWSIKATYRW